MIGKKIKIEIKTIGGTLLFKYESKDNTIKQTVERAVGESADLRGAYLERAYLEGADLRGADLRGAYLERAYLEGADLEGAYLRGAYLEGADLRGSKLEQLPQSYINQCSRDMLFIFEHLKGELPFLRDKLIKGEVDGTQYEGECACLIGSLRKADGGVDKVCEAIPYYDKGTHNLGEQWFWNIHKGDTPENSDFAKHALLLIDSVLGKEKKVRSS